VALALAALVMLGALSLAVVLGPGLWRSFERGDLLEALLPRGRPHSGWFAQWAGDVDGDGAPDYMLATGFEPADLWTMGRVRICSGADGACLMTLSGLSTRTPWERLVRPGGDCDGDGSLDLLVSRCDRMCVVSGRTSDEIRCVEDDWGWSFASAGDIDQDGHDDVLIADPLDDHRGKQAGRVRLVSGRDGSTLWEDYGVEPGEQFGWSVCGVGDVDGDGRKDFAITVNNDEKARHAVIVVSGRNFSRLRELPAAPETRDCTVEPGGDIDADGFPDILVGGTGGCIRAYSGRTGALLHEWRRNLPNFGMLYSNTGDVDGDGADDIVAGTWDLVLVFSGRTGEEIRNIADACMAYGHGDLDGDGHADLMITRNIFAKERDAVVESVWDRGRLEILSGADGRLLRALTGEDLGALKGR
jgi:hypothetical protein